jgi:dihydrofolate reductase
MSTKTSYCVGFSGFDFGRRAVLAISTERVATRVSLMATAPQHSAGFVLAEVSPGGGRDGSGAPVPVSGGINGQIVQEFMSTGAVVAGRGTFEPAGGWDGDHHDRVPIFVYSRHEPGIDITSWPLVSYVDNVEVAFSRATAAAGDKDVLVHGAAIAQLALAAGVLDELELHVVPVLLGRGRRLFDNLPARHIELERTRLLEGEDGVNHLHYRVHR